MDYKHRRKLKRLLKIPKARQNDGSTGYHLECQKSIQPYTDSNTSFFIMDYATDEDQVETEHPVVDIVEDTVHSETNNLQDEDVDTQRIGEQEDYIYDGCSIGYEKSRTFILSLLLRHNLPLDACEDLIKLINVHLPTPAIQRSKYSFFKRLGHLLENINKYYFCQLCNSFLGKNIQKLVSCKQCHTEIAILNSTAYYAQIKT